MPINYYNKSQFAVGAHKISQLPEDLGIEIAISGRSNAGKSSVLNRLTNNAKLAKISKTPGRTQQINVFTLDEQRRLIDLPGYGYARVSESMRRHWSVELNRYFRQRKCLSGLLLIMDIRHPFKESDWQQLDWSLHAELPTHILLNKADKYSRSSALNILRRLAADIDHQLVSIQLFSALKNSGADEARAVLDQWFQYS